MVNESKGIWSRYKLYFIAAGVALWGAVLLFAVKNNPTAGDTATKLAMMKADMGRLMALGGKVISEKENSKYGTAIAYKKLADEGWSDSLMKDYQAALLQNNWKPLPGSGMRYCKEGVLAEIEPHSGTHDGQGTNFVSMVYDAASIRKCAAS